MADPATLALLAASAFTSATLLPGSSEALLLAQLTTGHAAAPLVAVAAAANLAGSLVNWALGRFLMRWRDRRWFPVSAGALERAERWYRRHGLWSLLLAWVPVVGDPLTVAAGALRVGFWPFLILVGIGKAGRYAALAAGFHTLAG
ncbi:membrane protein YqaA with SNARE-associated domain [Cereibacter ovatus]|uniref:Membrane protein YqaA with SNARE-associated domain n=1 Tax=Cereibacter ovatus TaxID=439529 RepID=A0A285CIX3_9RHOB|nr:YqaA family protein [Cereibacter ovatus]SNX67469.1 membrane protein YqaA with SNARE-associated domain [Cereibacter ovatus]